MKTRLDPYLNFRDNAREAMEFYHGIFGGKLDVLTFKQLGASQDPSEEDLVMHSFLNSENGISFMASDTPHRIEFKPGTNMALTLSGDNEAELRGYFDKLAEGGNVTMPLGKSSWGDTFGMVVDKFGTRWMIDIAAPAEEK